MINSSIKNFVWEFGWEPQSLHATEMKLKPNRTHKVKHTSIKNICWDMYYTPVEADLTSKGRVVLQFNATLV